MSKRPRILVRPAHINQGIAAGFSELARNRDDELLKEGIIARSRYQATRSAARRRDAWRDTDDAQ